MVRALEALVATLPTKDAARAWYERCVASWGGRAVEETFSDGAMRQVVRRGEGGDDLLPGVSLLWRQASIGGKRGEGLMLLDGLQSISVVYGDDGAPLDRSANGNAAGRLGELVRLLAREPAPADAALRWFTSLDEDRFGLARVHYPVSAPDGLPSVVFAAVKGLRRALFSGQLPERACYVAIDGVAGEVFAHGSTRDEAVAACQRQLENTPVAPRAETGTPTDDYDDDGTLLARGAVPRWPAPGESPPDDDLQSDEGAGWRPDVDAEAWKGDDDAPPEASITEGPDGRQTVRFALFSGFLRGPSADAPALPQRPECTPIVVVPLEGPLTSPPPAGRWWRVLGARGRTGHVLRIDRGHDFVLVGCDLLGLVDLDRLEAALDHVEATNPLPQGPPEYAPFYRFRTRSYRWTPDGPERAQGLRPAGGSRGTRFDAAALDGDALQGQVLRFTKVWRPVT